MLQRTIDLNLERACIYAAGRFLVAYRYRPARAVSIRSGGCESFACTRILDCEDSLPGTLVTVSAAGLAAESLVFGGEFETLINDSDLRGMLKPDLAEAKDILTRAGLLPSPYNPVFDVMWRQGFDEACAIMENSVDELRAIAGYVAADPGRQIPREELVHRLDLRC